MTPLNMHKLMRQRAMSLNRRQPIIQKDLLTIRVPVNTIRQATKHNSNQDETPNCANQGPNGT